MNDKERAEIEEEYDKTFRRISEINQEYPNVFWVAPKQKIPKSKNPPIEVKQELEELEIKLDKLRKQLGETSTN